MKKINEYFEYYLALRSSSRLLVYPVRYAYDNKNYDDADYYWGKDIYQKNQYCYYNYHCNNCNYN